MLFEVAHDPTGVGGEVCVWAASGGREQRPRSRGGRENGAGITARRRPLQSPWTAGLGAGQSNLMTRPINVRRFEGKSLAADWKAKSAKVDSRRRVIWDRLEGLQQEVRKPLTDFQELEKARTDDHEQRIAAIMALPDFGGPQPASADIQARLQALSDQMQRDWQEFGKRATEIADEVRSNLQSQLAARQKYDADQAELQRLRDEKEKREQTDREERIRKEAAEAAELAAANALADAKAREEAATRAAEQVKIEAANAAKAAAERAALAAKEAAAKAERDKAAAVEAERARAAKAKADEDAAAAKREANKKHCAKINNAALDGLKKATGLDFESCKLVIEAIAKDQVPHTSISY